MLIEITGIDGSGKTTAIQTLRRKINEETTSWAYERSLRSNGIRLLESIAQENGHSRPYEFYSHEETELARLLELVQASYNDLMPGADAPGQWYFVDNYVLEWIARLFDRSVSHPEKLIPICRKAVKPNRSYYLEIDAPTAIERMRARTKGDSLLLEKNPEESVDQLRISFEKAIEASGTQVVRIDATQPPEKIVSEIWDDLFG